MKKMHTKLPSWYKPSGHNKINGIFDKGDVIVSKSTPDLIAIYDHTEYHSSASRNVVYYSTLYSEGEGFVSINCIDCGIGNERDCRLATEDEKNILIEALRKVSLLNGPVGDEAKVVLKKKFNIEVK